MSRKQFVTQLKTFKISELQQQSLNVMLESGTFATEAEIFRQGIQLVSMFNKYPQIFFDLINQYVEKKD